MSRLPAQCCVPLSVRPGCPCDHRREKRAPSVVPPWDRCVLFCEFGGEGFGLFVAVGGGIGEFDVGGEFAGVFLGEGEGDGFAAFGGLGRGGEPCACGFEFPGFWGVDGQGDGFLVDGVGGDREGVGAPFDADRGALVYFCAVLADQFCRHHELLSAVVVVFLGG